MPKATSQTGKRLGSSWIWIRGVVGISDGGARETLKTEEVSSQTTIGRNNITIP